MTMPLITIIYSLVLILLGLAGWGVAETKSITALIPAFAGVIFLVLGIFAIKPSLRREMMHAAAAFSLLCTLVIVRGLMQLPAVFRGEANTLAVSMQIAMGAVSGVFLFLCVRSFIQVRKARKNK